MAEEGEPGPRRTRVESLDALRGFAVLGILMVNVQAFAMSPYGYANPTVEADFGPQGRAIWVVVVAVFQMKFMTLFTAMFGAGIVLLAGEDDDPDRARILRRRLVWLLAIGIVHVYGFWYGDILAPYAVAGLLLTGVRAWSPARLLVTGLILTLGTSVFLAAASAATASLPPAEYAALVADAWAPPPEAIAERQDLFRQPWPGRIAALADLATERELEQLIYFMPRFLGVMMLGMALLKTGFFTGGWRVAHLWLAAALAPVGALLCWQAARMQIAAGFELTAVAPGQALVFLASLPQALGYAALVMLACRAPWLAWTRMPFAAVGRVALSCYLGCTLLCWFVFYGPPGLGRIGMVTRMEMVELVLWTWAGMLIVAPLWLRVFAFGPLEWAWRSLTYGRPQPWLARR